MIQRAQRLKSLEQHINRLDRRLNEFAIISERLTGWRLLVFTGGLAATLTGLAISNLAGAVAFTIALVGFAGLVIAHRRIERARLRLKAWRQIKATHLARMRLDWAQLPAPAVTATPDHPFALDLDLVGEYSIHRLLDTTVAKGGSDRLRDWLLVTHPDPDRISQRQALIHELIPMVTFRDRLALNARLAASQRNSQKWDGDRLLRWLRAGENGPRVSLMVLIGLAVLAVATIVLFILASVGAIPPLWIGTFVVYIFASAVQWQRLGDLFSDTVRLQVELSRLRAVLHHLETFPYAGRDRLRALCAPFKTAQRPSVQLRRVTWISAAASLQRNPMLWLMLNVLMPWDIFFAYLLERSKGDLAGVLPGWLEAWYDLEALNALANFAYLNPGVTFPIIDPDAVVTGEALGHPLIPAEVRVCNDFVIESLGRVVMITGSNMSGKSSFLRTVGVNMVLAYAGSPVCAQRFSVGLLRLYTCIRVADSVVDGISYFYAEVKRLKSLLSAVRQDGDLPVFFLIDEIFRGTNNRERLIGSRSYIRALAQSGSAGMISTHDLELVHLAESLPQISNLHFREDVVDGLMAFDYRLRSGPSPTTNALKIMALEGLPVDPHDSTTESQPSQS